MDTGLYRLAKMLLAVVTAVAVGVWLILGYWLLQDGYAWMFGGQTLSLTNAGLLAANTAFLWILDRTWHWCNDRDY